MTGEKTASVHDAPVDHKVTVVQSLLLPTNYMACCSTCRWVGDVTDGLTALQQMEAHRG